MVLAFFAGTALEAQTLKVIHSFSNGDDGGTPYVGVTMDRNGNLYGATTTGGNGFGTIYRAKHTGSSWIVTPLYSFLGGDDGSSPRSRLTIGPDGSLYGTTFYGGGTGCNGQGCGIVFNLQPPFGVCKTTLCPWRETVLYRFTGGTDGGEPVGDLAFDKAGNLYGTTEIGGLPHSCGNLGCGTVFELTRSNGSWNESAIHQFGPGDGSIPNGGVIFDRNGNLFGTTFSGGSANAGTVFELSGSPSGWQESVIYNFQGLTDGKQPNSGLLLDTAGNLYGTTVFGGTGLGGTVFELTPSGGGWSFSVLYSLTGTAGPFGTLMMDAGGSLYGTTYQDGLYVLGSAFELSPSGGGWNYTALHNFADGTDGKFPLSSLVQYTDGSFCGTSAWGGDNNYGVLVQIIP